MDENGKKKKGNSRILAALIIVLVGSLGIAVVMMAILPAKTPPASCHPMTSLK
jgi:hypothetical protein